MLILTSCAEHVTNGGERKMTFTQIQYFLEVCKTLNFTKAAQNLYVAQPTLSRQIQLLETELGVQLMCRSNRNVILTEAGKVFESEFDRIVKNIEAAIHKIQTAGNTKKEINIGLFLGLSPKMVYELMLKLKEYFPAYKVHMNKYSSFNLKQAFDLGSLDMVVSIAGTGVGTAGINACDVDRMPAFFVYSPRLFQEDGKPDSVKDFDGKNFVCIHDDAAVKLVDYQLNIVRRLGLEPKEIVSADNMVASLLYTESETGFSIYTNGTPEGLDVFPLPASVASFPLTAYWKKDCQLPLTAFFEECYGFGENAGQ